MKFIKLLIVLVFVFLLLPTNSFAASPSPKATQKPIEVNSFEMFWPIVAGKVQGDPLYNLKRFKENARGFLIFNNLKKAEYNAILSQKRLLEFEKLILVNKDYNNAKSTLDTYNQTLKLITEQLQNSKEEGQDVTLVSQNTLTIFEKEYSLLQSILSKVDETQKDAIVEVIKNLTSISSSL